MFKNMTSDGKLRVIAVISMCLMVAMVTIVTDCNQKRQPLYIKPSSTPKALNKGIEKSEKVVEYYTKEVINQKQIIASLQKTLNERFTELESAAAEKDTFQIVQIQDTIIGTLLQENQEWQKVSNHKDSIIVAQRFIINSKDTLLAIQAGDLKRVRRQRNWSILVNGLFAGLIIVK